MSWLVRLIRNWLDRRPVVSQGDGVVGLLCRCDLWGPGPHYHPIDRGGNQ